MAVPAAIYVRVSTADQAEKFSLDAQVRALRDLAASRDLHVIREYNEGGVSGESLAGRPKMQDLLDDADSGLFRVVLVVALDRLSRNLADNLFIRESLKNAGVRIATPAQDFDPSSSEHDLTQNLFGSIADYERKRILERCQAGRVEKRAGGGWLGGHAPFGYRFDPASRSLLPDPEAVPVVTRVYELALKSSPAKIERVLDHQLSARQIRRMLERRKILFYSGRVETYEGEIVPAEWPAILDGSLCDAVLAAKSARRARQVVGVSTHLLTGLGVFRCLSCGSTVKSFPGRKRKDGTRLQYYACSSIQSGVPCNSRRYVPCDIVDEAVSRAVVRGLKGVDLDGGRSGVLDDLSRRLDLVDGKIQRVLGLILDDLVSESEGRSQLRALRAEKQQVEVSIAEATKPLEAGSLEWVMDLDLDWRNQPEMREVISLVVSEILLSPRRVKVILRPPFEKRYNLPLK